MTGELSKRKTIGDYTVTVAKKTKAGMKIAETNKELVSVLARVRGLLVKPEGLVCTRCGATYDHERYGDTPILGQISSTFQLIVEDNNANEAIFYCQKCKHLFITEKGHYIQVIP